MSRTLLVDAVTELNDEAVHAFKVAAKTKIREIVIVQGQIASLVAKQGKLKEELKAMTLDEFDRDALIGAP